MPYNSTTNTWSQIANEQAYNEANVGNFNSTTLITEYDPVYNKLVEQISDTMYRRLQVTQRWRNLGRNAPKNAYPGILREIAMRRRKGQNFPGDLETPPNTLNSYAIYDDEIEVRYHSAQFRWMYPWTIYDEVLRKYSGGNGQTIAELAEMKMVGAISARNIFMDSLRKKTLFTMLSNVSTEVSTGIAIDDFSTLTQAQAQEWLNFVDNILFTLENGTALYNGLNEFVQTPRNRLQMVIPRELYMNVVRKAYPDTFNPETFMNILPANLILIDNLGDDFVATQIDASTPLVPSFDAVGMNVLNWDKDTYTISNSKPNWQCAIYDIDCLGFEDNLETILFGPKDIERLATPARSHFWTKAYFTDLLPSLVITE